MLRMGFPDPRAVFLGEGAYVMGHRVSVPRVFLAIVSGARWGEGAGGAVSKDLIREKNKQRAATYSEKKASSEQPFDQRKKTRCT